MMSDNVMMVGQKQRENIFTYCYCQQIQQQVLQSHEIEFIKSPSSNPKKQQSPASHTSTPLLRYTFTYHTPTFSSALNFIKYLLSDMLKTNTHLFLLACLITLSLSQNGIVEQHSMAGIRTVKQIKLDTSYSLINAGPTVWSEFPMLKGTFILTVSQYVDITYSIQNYSFESCELFIRLIIDGVEHERFRTVSAGSKYHSNQMSLPVWLQVGNHYVRVQFRTNGNFPTVAYYDWNIAFLEAAYTAY